MTAFRRQLPATGNPSSPKGRRFANSTGSSVGDWRSRGLAAHPGVGTLTLADNGVREVLRRVSYLKIKARCAPSLQSGVLTSRTDFPSTIAKNPANLRSPFKERFSNGCSLFAC